MTSTPVRSRLSVNADGRFVAFDSYSTNFVPGDSNGTGDIFVRDRQTGTIEIASLDNAASSVPSKVIQRTLAEMGGLSHSIPSPHSWRMIRITLSMFSCGTEQRRPPSG